MRVGCQGFEEVKIKYYELVIEYHTHERDAWELCQSYHHIYDTRTLKANDETRLEALRCTIIFLLLAPFTNHQSDMIHRVKQYKDLELIPEYKYTMLYVYPIPITSFSLAFFLVFGLVTETPYVSLQPLKSFLTHSQTSKHSRTTLRWVRVAVMLLLQSIGERPSTLASSNM